MDAQALIEVSIYARCSQFEFIRRKRSLFANDITTINENGSIEGRVLKISSGRLQRSDRGYDEKVSSVALTLRILGDADTTDSPRPRHPRRGDYDVPGITNRNTASPTPPTLPMPVTPQAPLLRHPRHFFVRSRRPSRFGADLENN